MTDFDRIEIVHSKLVALASELRGLKCAVEDNTEAATSLEYAEDAVDTAVRHCKTALEDIVYA